MKITGYTICSLMQLRRMKLLLLVSIVYYMCIC